MGHPKLVHTHEPLDAMTPTRLQVEVWRALDEPWGASEDELVQVPKQHLYALLQYISALEAKIPSTDLPATLVVR